MDDQRVDVSGGAVITRTPRDGDQRVSEVLASVTGVAVLHDLRCPNSAGTIGHIVVGPLGVFVVSAKRDDGRVERRHPRGRSGERLFVHGRDCTAVIDGVLDHVEVVRRALGDAFPGVAVQGVLCFVGCSWGVRMRPKVVKGVTSVWPIALPAVVAASGAHASSVPAIAEHLRHRLPSSG